MRFRWVVGIVAGLMAGASVAQGPGDTSDPRQRLIEQKIRLVETLINSPAAKNAAYGREAESAALIEKGRKAIDDARQALAEGRHDDAARLLDEALRSASSASRKMAPGDGSLSESAQRKTLQDLGDQVEMYRKSLSELAGDRDKGAAARTLLAKIDALVSDSRQLSSTGRLGDANKKMAEAYKLAVEEMSRLRAGQEVVLSLKFDTPADEYAYERKRFASNEIMVDMMIGEGRAEGDKRKLVDGFLEEGRRLGGQAEVQANAGKFADAVKVMEQASAQLIRALQSMGLPVF